MKSTITLLFLFQFTFLFSQIQFNNFETNFNLEAQIGTTPSDSLWQIGNPQKSFFEAAFSPFSAIITDTISTYPTNHVASFQMELTTETLFLFPFIQIEWLQKTDMEDGVDGGIVETSYDNGQTWMNVFGDSTYLPAVVGSYDIDTLGNNEIGFTGTKDWEWVAICWGTSWGTQPVISDNILIRFTFVSDSVDTFQEGWMMDNFQVRGEVLGSTGNQRIVQSIPIYPNPTQQGIYVDLLEVQNENAVIKIYNSTGALVYDEALNNIGQEQIWVPLDKLSSGLYILNLVTDETIYREEFIKMK